MICYSTFSCTFVYSFQNFGVWKQELLLST